MNVSIWNVLMFSTLFLERGTTLKHEINHACKHSSDEWHLMIDNSTGYNIPKILISIEAWLFNPVAARQ